MKFKATSSILLTAMALFTAVHVPAKSAYGLDITVSSFKDLCSDVAMGTNRNVNGQTIAMNTSSSSDMTQNDTSDVRASGGQVKDFASTSKFATHKNEKIGGGGSFMGIGANVNYEKTNDENHEQGTNTHEQSNYNTATQIDKTFKQKTGAASNTQISATSDISTVVTGKNCDTAANGLFGLEKVKAETSSTVEIMRQKAEIEKGAREEAESKARREMMIKMMGF